MRFLTLNLFCEKSLTQHMLEKTYEWNSTENLVSRWVVSRAIGSVGIAGASLIDAMREIFLSATSALTLVYDLSRPSRRRHKRFHLLRLPFNLKNEMAKDSCNLSWKHLHQAGIHVAVIFFALSLGVIAPSGLLSSPMVKMGFDVPDNRNLLNKIKAIAERVIEKRTVLMGTTVLGFAIAQAWASKRIPILNPNGSGVCAMIAISACIAGTLWKFQSNLSTPTVATVPARASPVTELLPAMIRCDSGIYINNPTKEEIELNFKEGDPLSVGFRNNDTWQGFLAAQRPQLACEHDFKMTPSRESTDGSVFDTGEVSYIATTTECVIAGKIFEVLPIYLPDSICIVVANYFYREVSLHRFQLNERRFIVSSTEDS